VGRGRRLRRQPQSIQWAVKAGAKINWEKHSRDMAGGYSDDAKLVRWFPRRGCWRKRKRRSANIAAGIEATHESGEVRGK